MSVSGTYFSKPPSGENLLQKQRETSVLLSYWSRQFNTPAAVPPPIQNIIVKYCGVFGDILLVSNSLALSIISFDIQHNKICKLLSPRDKTISSRGKVLLATRPKHTEHLLFLHNNTYSCNVKLIDVFTNETIAQTELDSTNKTPSQMLFVNENTVILLTHHINPQILSWKFLELHKLYDFPIRVSWIKIMKHPERRDSIIALFHVPDGPNITMATIDFETQTTDVTDMNCTDVGMILHSTPASVCVWKDMIVIFWSGTQAVVAMFSCNGELVDSVDERGLMPLEAAHICVVQEELTLLLVKKRPGGVFSGSLLWRLVYDGSGFELKSENVTPFEVRKESFCVC